MIGGIFIISDVVSSSSESVLNGSGSERELVARSRIKKLLDADSFTESDPYMSNTGLIWGYGTVDGRLVFVYSQFDAIGLAHAKRIAKTYISAIKVGAPVIGVHNSKGIRLEEGLDCMEAFGVVFSAQSEASGVVPQISVIAGDCIGSNAFIPALSDFRFKLSDAGYFFADMDSSPTIDYPKNNAVDFYFDNEQEMFTEVKRLLSYLPSNCLEHTPETDSQMGGADTDNILSAIADNGDFIEINKAFAKDSVIGFMRLEGRVSGFVKYSGVLDAEALSKACEFVRFCDSFNIPIISFIDVDSLNDTCADDRFLAKGARLIYAYAYARVPKINVITGKAIGASCLLTSCGFFAADIVYAWPDAVITPISADAAREIFGYSQETGAAHAAAEGYINDIISPTNTRSKLISALDMLTTKRVSRLTKRHGTIL